MAGSLALLLVLTATVGQTPRPDAETFFELKVRPLLTDTCLRCHGGEQVRGGLHLTSRDALLRGGDSGPAVVPGDPDRSLLIQAVRYTHDTIRMPPQKRLPAAVVADLETWVRQGAVWPRSAAIATPNPTAGKHWAFAPVRAVEPPPDPTGWAASPIDRFIAARLREHGLHPVRQADRRTLIRRLSFDLTGLPPTPDEIDTFLADTAPDADAKLVDRLLASPEYGECWGRHWMDVVRYADTAGDNADYPVPEARLYRDYVIDAFNADKPYDEFVREQLAGDLLAQQGPREKYAERVVATGFLALSRRYATAPYELWHLTLEDTIATTGEAFLGLTLRCARCHDHKFDPVSTEDYYALYGIFASTTFPYAGSEEFASMNKDRQHFVPLLPPGEAAPKGEAYRRKIADLEAAIKKAEQAGKAQQAQLNALRDELRALQKPGLPADLPGAYAVSEGKPVSVPIQRQGDPERPGRVVPRGMPKSLGAAPVPVPADASGRLQLAEWLTRPDHPLTARVLVNRLWQHHFGRGLVATPNNFGTRGEPPTHPELLDWLADRFVKSGWSVKALHRLILLSKTYQLAGDDDPGDAARDLDNRWCWHHGRRRLDAEATRDALLSVAGNLDRRRPGPHPFPPIGRWGWTQHNPFKDVYPSRHRSVYLMTQRLQRHPFLGLFDGPDTNASTGRRTTSTVPLQALYLMNNPFVREQAEGLARCCRGPLAGASGLSGPLAGASGLMAAAPDAAARVARAHLLAWGRPPSPAEVEKGVAYVHRYEEELARAGAPAGRCELEAWTSYARVLLTANEFVYVD
jgi:hypothetical protein